MGSSFEELPAPSPVSLWPFRGTFYPIMGFLDPRDCFVCLFIHFIIVFETRSCNEAQAGLGLSSLPQPPRCWNYRHEPGCLASVVFHLHNGCKNGQAKKPTLCRSTLQTSAYSFKYPDGSVALFQAALSMQRSNRGDLVQSGEKEYSFPTFPWRMGPGD